MKISNPFAKKKGKSKAVTSRNSKSKKTKPKNKKILAYFGIIAVLFVTSVTYGGYAMYQREALKAEAGSWTYLKPAVNNHGTYGVKWARACRKDSNSVYGPVSKISFQVYRNNTRTTQISMLTYDGYRNSSTINGQAYNDQWLYGVIAGLDSYASRYRKIYNGNYVPDWVVLGTEDVKWVPYGYSGGNTRSASLIRISDIRTC